jgi:hypothetical protein
MACMNDAIFSAPVTSPADAKSAGTSGISVIIPAHNAEATLNSVLRQTYAV